MKHLGLGLALLLMGAGTPVRAFVLQSEEVGGKLVHPRWDPDGMPVRFQLNGRPFNLLPNLTRTSNPLGAVQAALQSWAIGPVRLTQEGTVATTEPGKDGINLITFADSSRNRELTANAWAVTLNWFDRKGNELRMTEADLVMSPGQVFSTTGSAEFGDLQGIVTHELGHAIGLEHTPIGSATMFPGGEEGQFTLRTLDPDDIAAVRELYVGETGPDYGAITGQVLAGGDQPVFGAHVTAVDSEGIVQAGGLTDREGNFVIPSLPGGAYQLYAEPLDGPMIPNDLNGSYFANRSHPLSLSFHTTFLGGNASPTTARVEVGKSTVLDPIRVDGTAPGINPDGFVWTDDFKAFHSLVAPLRPGRPIYLLVLGRGLERVPTGGFRASSPSVAIDYAGVARDVLNDGTPFVILPIQRTAGARPGARSLYLAVGAERAALTGILEVSAP
jgi:hypothetical protein